MTAPSLCPHCGFDLQNLEPFELGMFHYSAEFNRISYCGTPLKLTQSEHIVLLAILRGAGMTISVSALSGATGYEGDGNVVQVFIARIRKKLLTIYPGADPIQTVRGAGYRYAL